MRNKKVANRYIIPLRKSSGFLSKLKIPKVDTISDQKSKRIGVWIHSSNKKWMVCFIPIEEKALGPPIINKHKL